ncbi:MAG: PspC domain-containing protein [Eubacterium sp.]
MKRLYRSKTDRQLAGVCGGIATYFNVDPSIVRLIWAIVSVLSTAVPGLLVYIVCAIVIPEEPDAYETTAEYHDDNNDNYSNSGM